MKNLLKLKNNFTIKCKIRFLKGFWFFEIFRRGGVAVGVPVSVSPDILCWVKQQVSPDVDASILDLLNQWILKKKVPKSNEVLKVSNATKIPFGYFFLKYPPKEECALIHCRTIDSVSVNTPSRELIDTYNIMTNAQNLMSEYNEEILELSPLPFVGRFDINSSVEDVVTDIRQNLQVNAAWFKKFSKVNDAFNFLKNKISNIGILVMQNGVVGNNNNRKLNLDEFRAFTLIDKYAPLIFINSNDSVNGKIFSLIHELAHIEIGENNLFNDDFSDMVVSRQEKFCNAIAAEFLVPKKIFIEQWSKIAENLEIKFSELAGFFKCSTLVVARRALDFGFISSQIYNEISTQSKAEFEKSKKLKKYSKPRGNCYNTLQSRWDKNFIMALDNSTKNGETRYVDAYRIVGLKGETFHELVERFVKRRVKTS